MTDRYGADIITLEIMSMYQIGIEPNRCATACKGCGAVFELIRGLGMLWLIKIK